MIATKPTKASRSLRIFELATGAGALILLATLIFQIQTAMDPHTVAAIKQSVGAAFVFAVLFVVPILWLRSARKQDPGEDDQP